MAVAGGCCKCCFSIIFFLGSIALSLWLALRVSEPKFSIQQFYIPALNKTLNSPKNTTLYFELELKNTNKNKGVYYDPINVTFFDSPNKSHSIGNFIIPNFYQGHNKKAAKGGQVETNGLDRESVFHAVSVNGSAVFWMDLATSVRYKILASKTKRHKIMEGAKIEVNDQGKLKSTAAKIGIYCGKPGTLLVNFLVLLLLNLW